MADTYTLHIAGLTRELPICKVNDHLDIAAFIMFSDVELTEACAAALRIRSASARNQTSRPHKIRRMSVRPRTFMFITRFQSYAVPAGGMPDGRRQV